MQISLLSMGVMGGTTCYSPVNALMYYKLVLFNCKGVYVLRVRILLTICRFVQNELGTIREIGVRLRQQYQKAHCGKGWIVNESLTQENSEKKFK